MTHPENLIIGEWYRLKIRQRYGDGMLCTTTFIPPMLLEPIEWTGELVLRFWCVEMGRVDVAYRDVLRIERVEVKARIAD